MEKKKQSYEASSINESPRERAYAESEGTELSDDELNMVSGGNSISPDEMYYINSIGPTPSTGSGTLVKLELSDDMQQRVNDILQKENPELFQNMPIDE